MIPEFTGIRVLHVITALQTGGAEIMLLRLLSAFKERYHHAVVSLKDEGTIGPRIKNLGVPLYTLGLRAHAPNPIRVLSIRSLCRQFRPHIIQGWMYDGNLMASLSTAGSGDHPPVIWGIHSSIYNLATERWRTAASVRLGAVFSRYPARIIYVSRISRTQHESLGYYSQRGEVIPNGIDCEVLLPDENARREVRGELRLQSDSVLIGLVARHHPMKDHSGFVRAAASIAQRYPNVYFVMAGRGVTDDEPSLSRMIATAHLENRAFLLGDRSDIPRLTAALDIACSSSAWGEAFSLAVGEAMACAVPCVVTDVGDNAFLVAETGVSVPPGDPEALAKAIDSLIQAGPAPRRHLGIAARRRIQSHFSLAKTTRQYQHIYEDILERVR